MRIGFTTNAPWTPTGYGVQAQEVLPRLFSDGHEVAVMANYGAAGNTLNWNGIPVMGQGFDAYSNDLTPSQIKSWIKGNPNQVGIGITLFDVWVYKSQEWDEIPLACWTPIDHQPAPGDVVAFLNRKGAGKWAIAMSRFGEREILQAGVEKDRVFYVPHSFNKEVFKPTSSNFRKDFDVPEDAHLTIINAANKGVSPIRKCWPEMFQAWSNFAKDRKDAYLLLWTEVSGLAQGVNLAALSDGVNAPREQVRMVPQFEYRQGINQNVLANAYSASDVLLLTSRGEGFGIPVIEAQACGTPVIVTDWTAQPELVGSGWKIDGQVDWDPHQNAWWKVPNVKKIEEALIESYELRLNKDLKDQYKTKAIDFASDYATDKVYSKYWRPVLKQIEQELSEKKK